MKRLLMIAIPAAALVGFGWLLWTWRTATDPGDASPVTEVPVQVGEIVRTTLRGYVTAYGTVEPDPGGPDAAAGTRLAPAVPGVVVAVHAVEGQQVDKGRLLFELDSRTADVAVKFARSALERDKQLEQAGGASRKRLQEAERQLDEALVQQALLRIRSPLAGTVTRVRVKPGEAVDLTTVLAEIVDVDRLVIGAGVPTSEAASLEPGQAAEIFEEQGTAVTAGILSYVSAGVDTATGTVPFRVSVPAGSGLRPGQFVGVRVVSVEHPDCLAVPVESITLDSEGATVIAIVRDGLASQRRVTTGLRDGGLVEIVAGGVQPGTKVVTEGAYALPKETRVRVLDN